MKPLLGLLGVGAACAACCTIPLALPMLAGLSASVVWIDEFSWQQGSA